MSKQQKADSVYKMLTRKSNKPKSSSPPLIELRKILNRVRFQLNLEKNELKNLKTKELISWIGLSCNSSIFIAT